MIGNNVTFNLHWFGMYINSTIKSINRFFLKVLKIFHNICLSNATPIGLACASVEVELRATFVQTRKCNGDMLVTRVKNTIGPWKGGKFMPLTMRPHSANTYALSKVWFKCNCINLRVCDYATITSQVKQWLYQDLLQKPSELALHRTFQDGGLGLFNVKIRAHALLIRAFLETAMHPGFRHQLLHEILYKYHVMGDTFLPDPGLKKYASAAIPQKKAGLDGN